MTNDQAPMTNERSDGEAVKQRYYLAERTAKFGESIIAYVLPIRRDDVRGPLIRQLVRSATSIGANYMEADEAGTKKEFRYRISVCCREARETEYWLRMLVAASPENREVARMHWQEAHELTRIFGAIHRNSKPTPK